MGRFKTRLLKRLVRSSRTATSVQFQSAAQLDLERIGKPIVVGAMGGSGTRAIVDLLTASGLYMGGQLDPLTGDSLPMRRYLARHFDQMIRDQSAETAHGPPSAALREFRRVIRAHRSGIPSPDAEWGWKNPRSMWILPFLSRQFPGSRFIHLVRDGRDMALTANRFLLDAHGDTLLGEGRSGDLPRDQLELWSLGNTRAAADAKRLFGNQSIRIRYEDLCSDPLPQLRRLLEFLERDLAAESIAKIARSIKTPSSIGRGPRSQLDALVKPSDAQRTALEMFGYRAD